LFIASSSVREGGEYMKKLMQKGFTLIELLVVIAIIGILSAVVLVSLNSARAKSRDARRLSDLRQIMTALEIYYNDNGAYPDAATTYNPTGPTVDSVGPSGSTSTEWRDFLAQWPQAPTPVDGTCAADPMAGALPAFDNTGLAAQTVNQYTYIPMNAANGAADTDGDPAFYRIYACLGAPTGGYLDQGGAAADGRVSIVATPQGISGY
jgi:prepilin-type N-terminal cleavage/methylation domain-containing protein